MDAIVRDREPVEAPVPDTQPDWWHRDHPTFTALTGFFTCLTLIMAIGAQNAFVLRQGLMRAHVLAVCLVCAASDAILVSAGVAGIGTLSAVAPWKANSKS